MSAPLYAYYGDDFTGSTDVLEALASAGLHSVLFLGVPSEGHRRRFSDCQAFGIAGDARSRSPEWMDENLPPIFECLRSFGAPIIHYKTCSTFDSSPRTGSIGRAMEIGRLPGAFVPIVVAAPHLRRYVVFGNLFAAAGDDVYRIDRHPTMRQHPVTPMYEADLRRHLAAQTQLRVGLVDLPTLQSGRAVFDSSDDAVLFDGMTAADLQETGGLIWQQARQQPVFAVGSSGVTYSLFPAGKLCGSPLPAEQLLVMSGSCSPVTERQIRYALNNGYEGIAIADATVSKVVAALRRTGRVVVYSSLGPLPAGAAALGEALGRQVGGMLREVIAATGLRRVVLAGGDTSSHAIVQLGLYALTWVASTQPGAPLCRGHSDSFELDGLELVLKGGQIGTEDFIVRMGFA